jgi:hypothetical protein
MNATSVVSSHARTFGANGPGLFVGDVHSNPRAETHILRRITPVMPQSRQRDLVTQTPRGVNSYGFPKAQLQSLTARYLTLSSTFQARHSHLRCVGSNASGTCRWRNDMESPLRVASTFLGGYGRGVEIRGLDAWQGRANGLPIERSILEAPAQYRLSAHAKNVILPVQLRTFMVAGPPGPIRRSGRGIGVIPHPGIRARKPCLCSAIHWALRSSSQFF